MALSPPAVKAAIAPGVGMLMGNTHGIAGAQAALTAQQKIARESMEDLLGMLPPEYHDILYSLLQAAVNQRNMAHQYAMQTQLYQQYALQNQFQHQNWIGPLGVSGTGATSVTQTPTVTVASGGTGGGAGGFGKAINKLLGGK